MLSNAPHPSLSHSYIYDPSVAVDVRKSDSAGSSLYQPHHLPGEAPSRYPLGGSNKHKQGFHNLGYSKSNDGTLKLEADNNHVNRLHAIPDKEYPQQARAQPAEGSLYIIQPEGPGRRWVMQDTVPSQVPIYPNVQEYVSHPPYDQSDRTRGYGVGGRGAVRKGWDSSIGDECGTGSESLSVDEGMGGTPEYPCDTGDEGSVLSGDIHTSTTSLSSADTKYDHRQTKTPDLLTVESGISITKSEDEEERREEDVQSVTESMVAEALAALEAATAGEEDFE